MSDEISYGAVIAAFAGLATAHVLILAGLLVRRPHWHALLALALPPLAPYWAVREGMRARGVAWISCVVAYGAALFFSRG